MIRVITNGHRRGVLYWHDLSEKERMEFDWLEDCETLSTDQAEFFRYKGWVYCLGDIMRIDRYAPIEFQGWDGYVSETFFSGILVRYPQEEWGDIDTEHVVVASYHT